MKFQSLRHKLLFWFLIFVSSNLLIVVINFTYLEKRDKIEQVFRTLEKTHGYLLEDYKNQLNFFTQETKNRVFFEFATSKFIDHHKTLFANIHENLNALLRNEVIDQFALGEDIDQLFIQIQSYDSLFLLLTEKIRIRGHKDYNTTGEMRRASHALEEVLQFNKEVLLTLRRHEKDYLLRHEIIYVRKLDEEAKRFIATLPQIPISNSQRKEIESLIQQYQRLFLKIVEMDREIGLYNNSGLKKQLDDTEAMLAIRFEGLLEKANTVKTAQFRRLQYLTIGFIGAFIFFGIWMSFIISSRITIPLTDLTKYITRFVGSNFTFVDTENNVAGADEIGKLTLNFNTMRDKIIEQLQFFKQKVEERTEELAHANNRLQKINEANQRFVPNEFLHYLNRKSIEEVHLGDNVARKMTVMFSDIRGFTKLSEKMTPQENFDFINAYLKEIVPHVREHRGFIDKYIGDSVMALFAGEVEHAIDSSIESQASVRRFNQDREARGEPPIAVGIGIHSGNLILGTIGEENRMETTVISDAVNTASRMEGLTSIYGGNIVISDAVVRQIQDLKRYSIRFLDTVLVKGKEKSIDVYEVLDGLTEERKSLKMSTIEDFQMAVFCYGNMEFKKAHKLFTHVFEVNHFDMTSELYISRCEKIMKEGTPKDWIPAQRLPIKK